MKNTLKILTVLLTIQIYAQIPANYYDSAIGLSGYALKTELKNIISNGHQSQGYDNLYVGYITTDSDYYYENDGTVLDMYSENPTGTDPYNFTHGNNQCGSQSNEGDCYNREHLMPQSWYNSASPMVADIHQVVPADGRVNNFRGHLPFGNVGVANWTSLNGSKRGTPAVTIPGYTGNVFEPIDEFKGDIARIYFYMATRYQNEIASWENANDGSLPTFDGTSDHVFEDWLLTTLISWHTNDPVSQREIDRNNAAYNFQGNANPFIDHPEWVISIWNQTPDTENPTAPTNVTASNVTFNSVELNWTAATDNVGVFEYDVYRDNVLLTSVSTTSYTDSGLTPETGYSYYIVAKDAVPNYSNSSNVVNITTLAEPFYLFQEDFNDCAIIATNLIAYNEASDKNWTCYPSFGVNNTGMYQMNGYNEDVPSKDWLITTNPVPFNLYTNTKLSVTLIHTYGTMPLDIVYSTDYDGVSNPVNYTWTAVPNVVSDVPDGTNTEVFQNIVDADVSGIPANAYLAFKYYSNGSPTRWSVDNLIITGDAITNIADFKKEFVTVYPNPSVNKTITIQGNTAISEIELYSILGKQIRKLKAINKQKITLTTLEKGMYFIKIKLNNTLVIKQITIQ